MEEFMGKDFLLKSNTARHLFHDICENMPICDYHCHLSPKEIYENKPIDNIATLWLGGDHYKWRLMRSFGIEEKYCTGNAPGKEKFKKYALALSHAPGNPLYHWSHLELQRYFGITTPLSEKTADEIYAETYAKMAAGGFTPRELIEKSNVKYICTTDDPADSLEYHRQLGVEILPFTVLPTFRPDKALNIEREGFREYIETLAAAAGMEINTASDVIGALYQRADYFNSLGCRVSDHSLSAVPFRRAPADTVNSIFASAMRGEKIGPEDAEIYKTALFLALGKKYAELNWVMEVHIGALRDNNTKMYNILGADAGFDSVGDPQIAVKLSALLDALCQRDSLPQTVLFNLNAKDNGVLASMLGNFQEGGVPSKIQLGPAWWFLDTRDGMRDQLKTLANYGVLGKFIGMETDSRSFTSYTRHEYFRRILCDLIGTWVEEGMFPADEELLGEMLRGICYNNAVEYFGFE